MVHKQGSHQKLHAYRTPEAVFVEQGLIIIRLSDVVSGNSKAEGLEVCVPSLTNQSILKLFAFDERCEGPRADAVNAQAHAFDIFVIVTLANINDYKQGQKFLADHRKSEILHKAQSIVKACFSTDEKIGWRRALEVSSFYPELNLEQKRQKLDAASRRLVRWFSPPE